MTEAHATQPVTTPAAPAVATPAHPAHPHGHDGHVHGHAAHPQHAAHPHTAHHTAAAARAPVQAPESNDAQPAATDATTAVIPPKPEVNIPAPVATHAAGHGHGHAANDPHAKDHHHDVAAHIEKNIAHYIGATVSDIPSGAQVDKVMISDTTPVSAMCQDVAGQKDVGISVTGVDVAHREVFANKLNQALLKIPGLENAKLETVYQTSSQDGSHLQAPIYLRFVRMNHAQLETLKHLNAVQGVSAQATSAACAHGAGCQHCAAPQVTAVAPDVTQVAPATTVGAPGELQGQIAANNEKMQERA